MGNPALLTNEEKDFIAAQIDAAKYAALFPGPGCGNEKSEARKKERKKLLQQFIEFVATTFGDGRLGELEWLTEDKMQNQLDGMKQDARDRAENISWQNGFRELAKMVDEPRQLQKQLRQLKQQQQQQHAMMSSRAQQALLNSLLNTTPETENAEAPPQKKHYKDDASGQCSYSAIYENDQQALPPTLSPQMDEQQQVQDDPQQLNDRQIILDGLAPSDSAVGGQCSSSATNQNYLKDRHRQIEQMPNAMRQRLFSRLDFKHPEYQELIDILYRWAKSRDALKVHIADQCMFLVVKSALELFRKFTPKKGSWTMSYNNAPGNDGKKKVGSKIDCNYLVYNAPLPDGSFPEQRLSDGSTVEQRLYMCNMTSKVDSTGITASAFSTHPIAPDFVHLLPRLKRVFDENYYNLIRPDIKDKVDPDGAETLCEVVEKARKACELQYKEDKQQLDEMLYDDAQMDCDTYQYTTSVLQEGELDECQNAQLKRQIQLEQCKQMFLDSFYAKGGRDMIMVHLNGCSIDEHKVHFFKYMFTEHGLWNGITLKLTDVQIREQRFDLLMNYILPDELYLYRVTPLDEHDNLIFGWRPNTDALKNKVLIIRNMRLGSISYSFLIEMFEAEYALPVTICDENRLEHEPLANSQDGVPPLNFHEIDSPIYGTLVWDCDPRTMLYDWEFQQHFHKCNGKINEVPLDMDEGFDQIIRPIFEKFMDDRLKPLKLFLKLPMGIKLMPIKIELDKHGGGMVTQLTFMAWGLEICEPRRQELKCLYISCEKKPELQGVPDATHARLYHSGQKVSDVPNIRPEDAWRLISQLYMPRFEN